MKKKVIVNRQKLTREANLFPTVINGAEKSIPFQPQAKNHTIEKFNGYWKVSFKNKK